MRCSPRNRIVISTLVVGACGGGDASPDDLDASTTDACALVAPPTITSAAAVGTCTISGAYTYKLELDEVTSIPADGITASGGTIIGITPALPSTSDTFEIVVDLSVETTLRVHADSVGGCAPAEATVTITPWTPQSRTFDYTGAIETFTVPEATSGCGTILEVWGAQGGRHASSTADSGHGARMRGIFATLPSRDLRILVGEQPSADEGNGGGGGSFVVTSANVPLVIAGGGGGSAESADGDYKHGSTGTSGRSCPTGGGIGGQDGNGGGVGASGIQSGAGGGLLTSGSNGFDVATGGASFLAGGSGGTDNAPADGGFGGGGSGTSSVLGGGGGGYSGGAGCSATGSPALGAGGGSYNAAPVQDNEAGVQQGHGRVVIRW